MKVHNVEIDTSYTTYVVELEPHEVSFSDKVLITMCDNGLETLDSPAAKFIDERCEMGERCDDTRFIVRHFGGKVERRPGKKDKSKLYAKVIVWTE